MRLKQLPVSCYWYVLVTSALGLRKPVTALSTPPWAVSSTALVTGSSDGIGLTTAKTLARNGINVLVHGRDPERIAEAVASIEKFTSDAATTTTRGTSKVGRVFPLPPADLSTIHGCRSLATSTIKLGNEENLALSILVNNAGVYAEQYVVTGDGLEQTFAVNVLAPFIITSHLLPTLLENGDHPSRIVTASSISQSNSIRFWNDVHLYQKRPYSAHGAYSDSKLLDAMLTFEMASRLTNDGNYGTSRITCSCCDPGTVNTKMLLAGWGPIGIAVEEALHETWLCTSNDIANVTGQYFISRRACRASASAYDERERARMWSLLSELAPDAAAMWKFDWKPSAT